jgi:rifampicin phosphotransferase
VKNLFEGSADKANRAAEFEKRRDELRARVPADSRSRFDDLLEESRFIHRLRDERGMYNDLWGMGLARRAILEAGRRLKENGVLPEAELAINASHDELVGLLSGEKHPAVDELRRRQVWRESKTVMDAPLFLGGSAPPPPPPVDWLPEKARPNARAVTVIIREIFDVSTKPVTTAARTVEGIPVHPGVYEGAARIVHSPADFDRLQRGDVLVTRSTGPAFNVVLPLLGAIVTDRGGQLSHAAIVAREYGIPAVVGTRDATAKIGDGARVRVNGDTGSVELLS